MFKLKLSSKLLENGPHNHPNPKTLTSQWALVRLAHNLTTVGYLVIPNLNSCKQRTTSLSFVVGVSMDKVVSTWPYGFLLPAITTIASAIKLHLFYQITCLGNYTCSLIITKFTSTMGHSTCIYLLVCYISFLNHCLAIILLPYIKFWLFIPNDALFWKTTYQSIQKEMSTWSEVY